MINTLDIPDDLLFNVSKYVFKVKMYTIQSGMPITKC